MFDGGVETMYLLKIIFCMLASIIWIIIGSYMIINPKKAENKKSIFVVWIIIACILAISGGVLL